MTTEDTARSKVAARIFRIDLIVIDVGTKVTKGLWISWVFTTSPEQPAGMDGGWRGKRASRGMQDAFAGLRSAALLPAPLHRSAGTIADRRPYAVSKRATWRELRCVEWLSWGVRSTSKCGWRRITIARAETAVLLKRAW